MEIFQNTLLCNSRGQAIANQIRSANPQLAEQLGVSNPNQEGGDPTGNGGNPNNEGNL